MTTEHTRTTNLIQIGCYPGVHNVYKVIVLVTTRLQESGLTNIGLVTFNRGRTK